MAGTDAIGLYKIVWRGKEYHAEKGSKLTLAGVENDVVLGGDTGLFSEKFGMGSVEATVLLEKSVDFNEFDGGLGTCELQVQERGDAGRAWTMMARVMKRVAFEDKGTASVSWNFNNQQQV